MIPSNMDLIFNSLSDFARMENNCFHQVQFLSFKYKKMHNTLLSDVTALSHTL